MTLIAELKKFYKENRRELPWRTTRDPYKILVSEVMLQQTQVERVIPKYKAFLREFPNVSALANSSLSKVLGQWQGLGYNRRGKFLHEAAKAVIRDFGGTFPTTPEEIEQLPGVGHYTARAVAAFAYNYPDTFIETNIRTVFTHFYFSPRLNLGETVDDKELLPLIERDFKKSKMEPRDFYAALMDYGSYLKKSGIKINKQSKHYTKQKKFEGSERQLRGAILRELLKQPQTLSVLIKKLPAEKSAKEKVPRLLARLVSEGLLKVERNRYIVAD